MFWRKAKFLSFECIYFKGTDQYKHARDSQKATFLSIVCSRSEKNEREMWSLKMLFSFVKLRQVWLPSSQDLTSSHVYIIPSQWQFIIKWVRWSFTSRKFKSKFKTIKQQWHSQSSYNPASNLCAAPQRAIVRATEKKNCFLAPFKMNSELYRQRKSEMPRPCNKMGSNLAGYCSTALTSHFSLSPSSLFTPQNTGCYLTLQGCSVKKIGGVELTKSAH